MGNGGSLKNWCGMSNKKKEWLKITVDRVDLPNGLKVSGLEFSVYDFEALKALRHKVKNILGGFLGK